MAKYKCSLAPYRVAIIELHPYGATYPYHVVIDDINFHDQTQYCDAIFRRCCVFSSDSIDHVAEVLSCFSDSWEPCECFDDAMQILQADYEEKKGRLNGEAWGVTSDDAEYIPLM